MALFPLQPGDPIELRDLSFNEMSVIRAESAITPGTGMRTNISTGTTASQAELEYATFENRVSLDRTSRHRGTAYPAGTVDAPVNNLADALIIANERGLPLHDIQKYGKQYNPNETLYDVPLPWDRHMFFRPQKLYMLAGDRQSGKSAMVDLAAKSMRKKFPNERVLWVNFQGVHRHPPASGVASYLSLYGADIAKATERTLAKIREVQHDTHLIVIEDLQAISKLPGPYPQTRGVAGYLFAVKQAIQMANIPLICTVTTKSSSINCIHPSHSSGQLFADERFDLHTDTDESWELVDEAGKHLGHRITVNRHNYGTDLDDLGHLVTGEQWKFWIDGVNQRIYHEHELERKVFED